MKKIAALFLCVFLAAALVMPAAADPAENFLYKCYSADDQFLYCLGAALPGEGTVTVTSGGKTLTDCLLTTAQEAQIPITYLIVVDQSTAFSLCQKEQQKEALTLFSEKMRPIDRMILGQMEKEFTIGPVLTDRQSRDQAIEEACVYTAWGSDPYQTIVTALEYLGENDLGLCCLVMMSDGIDDWGMDVNEAMAREAIRLSGLSYHTFSLVDPFPGGYAVANAARMQSMSQESPGGVHVAPNRDQIPTAQAVSQIMEAMEQSAVIRIDTAQLDRSQGTAQLQVCWQGEGMTWQGEIAVNLASLPEAPTQPQTEATEITEPETTQPETSEPEITQAAPTEAAEPETTQAAAAETAEQDGQIYYTAPAAQPAAPLGDTLFYYLIGGGIAIILIAIAIVILLSRRQAGKPRRETAEQEDSDNSPAPERVTREPLETSLLDKPVDFASLLASIGEEPGASASRMEVESVSTPGCMVELTPECNPDGTVEFFLPVHASMTVGRNSQADVVLNETDAGLSAIHFQLHWDGRVLFLQDMKSTNGTTINGLPLRSGSWVRVGDGCMLQAGEYRYKLSFSKSE